MKKYKVKSLYVAGTKRRVFTAGDQVTEEDFPSGNAQELCRKGYLDKVGEDDVVPKLDDAEPEFIEKKIGVDDVSIAQMKKDLTKSGVDFAKNITKVDLFQLWEKLSTVNKLTK